MRYLAFIILMIPQLLSAQAIIKLTKESKTNIRGLSVVNDNVIWVSGSNGMVGKSLDGGTTWKWKKLPSFEKTDFRDIEAFDENTAVIVSAGEPAYILRTDDGGHKWKQVYVNTTHGIFLDGMEFWNNKLGVIIGDPIRNKFTIVRTYDGGKTWHDIDHDSDPLAAEGEACFAASGTNIRTWGEASYYVTGGKAANLYVKGKPYPLPIIHGKASTGANSIALKDGNTFIVVGGDFEKPSSTTQNACYTHDGGITWSQPEVPPHGYRSCVEYLRKRTWITCGINGVDITKDDGKTWEKISSDTYNVCRKAKKGKYLFLAGANGLIGKYVH